MRDSYNSGHTQLRIGREVRGVCRDFAVGERSEYIIGVHKLAAREIEDAHAVFHFAYRLRVYNISRAVVARDVQGQVIRRAEKTASISSTVSTPLISLLPFLSKQTTLMPRSRAASATSLPIAPMPTTPMVLPFISGPANELLPFSTSLPTLLALAL